MTKEDSFAELMQLRGAAEIREALSKIKALLVRAIRTEGASEQEVSDLADLLLMAITRDVDHFSDVEAAVKTLPEGPLRNTFCSVLLAILQQRIDHYRRFAQRVCGDFSGEQRQKWPHLFVQKVDP